VALLSVIGAYVGCTCESGCPVRRERHGRGGDVLLRVLRLMEPGVEAGGGLTSSAICAFYIHVRGL
jgi:hypothetical protein